MRISDWSSDVCSSDLPPALRRADKFIPVPEADKHHVAIGGDFHRVGADRAPLGTIPFNRQLRGGNYVLAVRYLLHAFCKDCLDFLQIAFDADHFRIINNGLWR